MCRSNAEGGRRCPGHSDPVKVSAYNAIRRARYKARKGAETPDTVNHTQPASNLVVEPSVAFQTVSYSNRLFNGGEENWAKQYSHDETTIKRYQKLNISTVENKGELVDNKYFNSLTIEGTPNYTEFDENTYKVFGFTDPNTEDWENELDYCSLIAASNITANTDGSWGPNPGVEDSINAVSAKSAEEMNGCWPDEATAAAFFTTPNYTWINRALYTGDVSDMPKEPNPDRDDYTEIYTGQMSVEEAFELDYKDYSVKLVKETAKRLDSLLENQSPGIQRKLYRGIGGANEAWGIAGFQNHVDWANTLTIGSELKYDGYQSSTISRVVGESYASRDGVLFEILTPAGVNINSVSSFDYEREVVLPRNSRYMVVGKHEVRQPRAGITKFVIQLVAINDKGEILNGRNSDSTAPLSFE